MINNLIATYRESFSGLSRETWTLSTVIFINRCSSMAVPFMSLYMTQYLHRPMADAGLIIALFGAGSLVGASVGGKLTDMIGFAAVQIYSAILGGIFFILFSTITHFQLLCVCTLLISFFSEAFKPANYAAIAVYAAPGTLTRSYSLNRLGNNLGFAIGSGIGGIIASFSYPMLFVVDGVVSVLSGIAILIVLPAGKKLVKAAKEKISDSRVIKPWKDGLFMKFLLLNVLLTICFFLLFRVVPIFYKEVWHIDEFWIGMILGANGLIIALFEMVMISTIENKKSPIQYIIMGVLMIAASYSILLLPGIMPVLAAVLITITFTIGEMLALPFINTFVMSRTTDHNRGQYAAGYSMSWSISQVVGPSAGFFFAEMYGYNWLWVGLILLLLLCAWGFKLLGRNMD